MAAAPPGSARPSVATTSLMSRLCAKPAWRAGPRRSPARSWRYPRARDVAAHRVVARRIDVQVGLHPRMRPAVDGRLLEHAPAQLAKERHVLPLHLGQEGGAAQRARARRPGGSASRPGAPGCGRPGCVPRQARAPPLGLPDPWCRRGGCAPCPPPARACRQCRTWPPAAARRVVDRVAVVAREDALLDAEHRAA